MGRLDARLAKFEASAGQADVARYWQAEADLQPAVDALGRQCYEEGWPVLKYLDKWMALRKTLPPYPKRRESTPEERDRAIAEMMEKLNGPSRDGLEESDRIDPYGLDELTEEIRAEEEAYLRQRGCADG